MDAPQHHLDDPEPALFDELADACLEHDAAHCRRVCEQLRALVPQQREDTSG